MKRSMKITAIAIIVLVAAGLTLHLLDPFGIRQHDAGGHTGLVGILKKLHGG
ncbi:hypothetical protein [Paenibacillus hexagrammi]|uniref:Uncharacterized protein n=1 Tax=Paenibacillus hexagrammi TaxID=2908839 RepID=A0ABY3SEV8_9BACL|nr:hypothetical protein [Paenibacillus sp. YPD9-1]UJF31452.1 hypothetical protein L0M14_16650 [Paenibacillus sp. YPD9-1]